MENSYIIKKEVNAFECQRCGHIWIPRVSMDELEGKVKQEPMICPRCKTPYWRTKRKNKENGK
jgi:Zn finger protein HypA/HybF involved in hydrogenase expression